VHQDVVEAALASPGSGLASADLCQVTPFARPARVIRSARRYGSLRETRYVWRLDTGVPRLTKTLDDHRHPLAAAHAHGFQADRLVFRDEAVQQGAEDAGPRHPEGMAERDRAAVRIELVAEWIDAELPCGGDHLGREGCVDFDYIDIGDRHARPLERLPRRLDRAKAHDFRLQRRDAGGDDACE